MKKEVIRIEGGHTLEGTVHISGAKNATVALIPAAVMADGPVTIVGVPDIEDVKNLTDILHLMNVKTYVKEPDHIVIDPTDMKNIVLDDLAVTKLRASYYFMGALLGKYKKVRIRMSGGCYLGPRPIDLHLKGFEALGAKVEYTGGLYTIEAEKLVGTRIFLDFASVGATINILMAAVFAEGRTTIENAAKEPEIIDVVISFFFFENNTINAPTVRSIAANDDGLRSCKITLSEARSPSRSICAVTVLPTLDPNTTGSACDSFMIPAFTKPLTIMVTAAEL